MSPLKNYLVKDWGESCRHTLMINKVSAMTNPDVAGFLGNVYVKLWDSDENSKLMDYYVDDQKSRMSST